MKNVLIGSSRPDTVTWISRNLDPEYLWAKVATGKEILDGCNSDNFDFLFVELDQLRELGDPSAIKNSFTTIRNNNPLCHIVVMSEIEHLREMVGMLRLGANDYLTIPIIDEEVKMVLESAADQMIQQTELDYLRDRFWKVDAMDVVKTRSAQMSSVFKKIRSVAPTKALVLFYGETGTGKGVMARLLHQHSNRADESFIGIHCGAIPDTLLESELFGHEKGAFTGATRKKLGKFEIATNGTIFLDEVGTITPAAQIKLLQVLQDGTFSRVGGEEIIVTDARIIAATNTDLKVMAEEGAFRKDLFYRLNVFPIEIPPLRDRKEDIPHLAGLFLDQFNQRYQKEIGEIHPIVLEAMQRYDWPGNVRELENVIERAHIIETGPSLLPHSFPSEIMGETDPLEIPSAIKETTLAEARRVVIEAFESQYLKDVLEKHNGRINKSAESAGVGVRQFHKLMQKYNIRKERFQQK